MIGRTLSFEAPSSPGDPSFQVKRDELNKKQEYVLKFLNERNKFRSDPIDVLSMFQYTFYRWIEGINPIGVDEAELFKSWDNMKYEKRIEVAIKFLEEGKQ